MTLFVPLNYQHVDDGGAVTYLRIYRKAHPADILSAALGLDKVEQLMEVTDKNAPVLSDGRYLPPGTYAIIPLPEDPS